MKARLFPRVDGRDVVSKDVGIGRDHRQAFDLCLRDQEAIEWILVMRGQRCHSQGMLDGDVQEGSAFGLQLVDESVWARFKLEATSRVLDADLDHAHGGEYQLFRVSQDATTDR